MDPDHLNTMMFKRMNLTDQLSPEYLTFTEKYLYHDVRIDQTSHPKDLGFLRDAQRILSNEMFYLMLYLDQKNSLADFMSFRSQFGLCNPCCRF